MACETAVPGVTSRRPTGYVSTLMRFRPDGFLGCILLLGCLLPLGGVGCVSPIDGGRGFAPFFETYPTKSPGDTKWILRPLVKYEREGERTDLNILWPIYRDTREGEYRKQWLLPIWYNSKRPRDDGEIDWDSFLFPLFFYGNDPDEGGYFLFLPFGGVIKGAVGQDHMALALFPLYLRMRDRERVSNHYLWPIFNRVKGPYHDGFRIWPFYGRYKGTTREPIGPKYDRRFYMWPFVHAVENDLDMDRPVRTRWLFPFYGRIETSNMRKTSVLWPLYTYGTREKEQETSHSSFLLGWRVVRSPEESRTDFGPIFGVRETRDKYRHFVLFPFHRYVRWKETHYRGTDNYWLPFYRNHYREDLRDGKTTKNTYVWPLFSRRQAADGTVRVNSLELWPFHAQGFDDFYARFWRVFRYLNRGPDRGHAWEFLWGAVRREHSAEHSWFSLLGGLYESQRTPEGTKRRFLYLPIRF